MPRALVALGANLGNREQTLWRAAELLAAEASSSNLERSSSHETAPKGGPSGQGPFLNAAVALDTTLAAEALHALLERLEADLGRRRGPRWGPRTIDLDLLLYSSEVIQTPRLCVPHPRMAFRRFVLAPAAEVAPEMVHPLVGWTIARLLEHLDTAAPYVALLGGPQSGRSSLAQAVARAVGGSFLSAADPSGHVPSTPIQFLDRAARLLQSRDWHAEPRVVVSDFYFDEGLARARVELDDRELERLRQSWTLARRRVVAPKLLVVLDELLARSPQGQEPAATGSTGDDRLRQEVLALAARPGQPVLYAGRDDPRAQFDEIAAAIAAMG